MAQRRESLNMGEFAEEAVTVEEVAAALNLFHAYNPDVYKRQEPALT